MMNHSCFCVLRRGVVAVAVFGHLGLLAVPAAAQQTAAPPGPVLPLSMSQAEAMALESNLGLRADRLAPDIASENLAAACWTASSQVPVTTTKRVRAVSRRMVCSLSERSGVVLANIGH
jgi:hypothetical protein